MTKRSVKAGKKKASQSRRRSAESTTLAVDARHSPIGFRAIRRMTRGGRASSSCRCRCFRCPRLAGRCRRRSSSGWLGSRAPSCSRCRSCCSFHRISQRAFPQLFGAQAGLPLQSVSAQSMRASQSSSIPPEQLVSLAGAAPQSPAHLQEFSPGLHVPSPQVPAASALRRKQPGNV